MGVATFTSPSTDEFESLSDSELAFVEPLMNQPEVALSNIRSISTSMLYRSASARTGWNKSAYRGTRFEQTSKSNPVRAHGPEDVRARKKEHSSSAGCDALGTK